MTYLSIQDFSAQRKIKEEKKMIEEAILNVSNGENLNSEQAETVMDEIMSGQATQAQIGSLLTALHIKGETIDEVTAFAKIMRKHCGAFTADVDESIDIVGTGGDCAGTFNISTVSSMLAAAGGAKVAKHGNRAASSKCGTADCLEAMGVNLMADAKVSEKCLKELGICFLFAQKYHTAMKYVGGPRREIKIPTVFNILGPLANPAKANTQLLGVYDEALLEPLARVLSNLGVKRGMVVHGDDGLDEISSVTTTKVCEFNNGEYHTYTLNPEEYGYSFCKKEELNGGTPQENAQIARDILSGKIRDGKRTAVILNAGAALHITNQISLKEGMELAEKMIDTGAGLRKLDAFVAATNQ